jgi:hypothetical protein
MTGDDKDLERIAAGIADDAALDWRALAKLDGHDADTGDGLRELSQLANIFRSLQLKPERAASVKAQFRFAGLDVIEKLGQGAHGEVWRAYDPMLDQDVALKLKRVDCDELSHQFLAEARRLAKVRQQNVVSVYGAAAQDGRVGLWTELVRGRSLADVLADEGPLSLEEVTRIGIELCRGLAAVHRHGLTHGDVKAENVLREVSGRVVLADFGTARELDCDTRFETISGTRHYLAPELIDGEPSSAATDQFALGVLLYRLLTGQYPYQADDLEAQRSAELAEARRPLREARPDLPRAFVRAIERSLAPEPARRHAGVLAMLVAIENSQRPFRRRGLPWAFAASLVAALVAAWFALRPPPPALNVDAAFYRDGQRGRERLVDGATIELGDRLRLELSSNRPTWLYVLNDDGSAVPTVLFPLPGVVPVNPLEHGVRWQLPGKDGLTALSWQVDAEAERETFVVVASSTPLSTLEDGIAQWRHAATPDNALVMRGVGRLVPSTAEPPREHGGLAALLGRIGCDAAATELRCIRFVFPHATP